MVLGLFTGLKEVGGIQRISQHTAAVLHEEAANQGSACELFGLNDPFGAHSFVLNGREYSFAGFARNQRQFVTAVLGLARRADLAYLGHVNLAPVGLAMRILNPKLRFWVAAYGVEVWAPLPTLRRFALRAANGVTALSRFTAEEMIKAQRLDPRRVMLLPPALDPSFTQGCKLPATDVRSGQRVILTVGRLLASEPGKGVDTLIHALPTVLDAIPDTLLVIVGDGDHRPYLETLARELAVWEKVLFVGEKRGEALKSYYQRADVFAMPSRQEGFGLVFLEAMAFGKPVVAGNYGGTPEVVSDSVSGYLVEYDDVAGLAARLVRLLGDETLRQRMGAAGRRLVEEKYTFERFQSRLARIVEDRCAS